MSLANDPHTMKVVVADGKPMPCSFDADGTDRFADWRVRYKPDVPPSVGDRLKVEIRIAPGVVAVGQGLVSDASHYYGDGWDVTIRGAGELGAPS